MARTHNAGSLRFHQDDGVVLGKGGVPIPTTPTRGIPTLHPHAQPGALMHMDDGQLVSPPPKPPVATTSEPPQYEWRCDPTTWGRSLDGFQALHLVNAILKKNLGTELSVVLTDDEARKLPADTRWHFKRQLHVPAKPLAPLVAQVRAEPQVAAPRVSAPPRTKKKTPAPKVADKPKLTEAFDTFVLAALSLGGEWSLVKFRDAAVTADPTLGVTPTSDLRSIHARLMGLKRLGRVDSPGAGLWRLAGVAA